MDLVTGATGIVGSHVLLECARHGPVRAIHRTTSDLSTVDRIFHHYGVASLLSNVEWVRTSLEDSVGLNAAMLGIRIVYHAAALVSFDPRDASALHRTNVLGTAAVVNAALANNVERLCHVSSTAAIGTAAHGSERTESLPWDRTKKTSAYAESKWNAELEVFRGIAEGLEAVIVNPCVVLGPGSPGRSTMTLVERIRQGSTWFPPGSNAVVDARDVASCMVRSMDLGVVGERYLLIGENLSYKELFDTIADAFGVERPHRQLTAWMLEAGWRVERIRSKVLGTRPLLTRSTAQSALENRKYQASKAREAFELTFRTAQESVENVARFLTT